MVKKARNCRILMTIFFKFLEKGLQGLLQDFGAVLARREFATKGHAGDCFHPI